MKRRFSTLDVFTTTRFGGNPLAVVLDAEGLETATMQAIAAEFNYSETTFVLPPKNPANTAEVRIFTPKREVPFAGHPNVGTAFLLASEGWPSVTDTPGVYRFEEKAGLVPVSIAHGPEGAPASAELTAPEALARQSGIVSREDVAACLSLPPEAIAIDRHAPEVVSVGLPFLVVEIASRAALADARPDTAVFARHLPVGGAVAIYFYTREVPADEQGLDLQARMFSPLFGINEDPATGSATAAAGALQAELAGARPGETVIRVGQGFDMGRPSRLTVRVVTSDDGAASVHVGGACVRVMDGTLEA